MSKIEKLKEKYAEDADMMASKSRFGFFSMPPSHTAAIPDFVGRKPDRQQDGKVHTEPRNIFSGINTTGSLKKNFFSYVPSAFHGSSYQDPGKHQREQRLKQQKKYKGHDIYKPASLNKTIIKASYQYMSETDPKKIKKNHRNQEGKVITENSNILISPQSKIEFTKIKKFIYKQCPETKQLKRATSTKNINDEPFRIGSHQKNLFSTHTQVFFDTNLSKKAQKQKKLMSIKHEDPFKPSCILADKPFTPFVYKEQGNGKQPVKQIKKQNQPTHQPFRLTKVQFNSKPCPSISLSKTNLLRGYR